MSLQAIMTRDPASLPLHVQTSLALDAHAQYQLLPAKGMMLDISCIPPWSRLLAQTEYLLLAAIRDFRWVLITFDSKPQRLYRVYANSLITAHASIKRPDYRPACMIAAVLQLEKFPFPPRRDERRIAIAC